MMSEDRDMKLGKKVRKRKGRETVMKKKEIIL